MSNYKTILGTAAAAALFFLTSLGACSSDQSPGEWRSAPPREAGGEGFSLFGSGTPPAKRPNIVMVVVDDLDERITPYFKVMKELKKLADGGMVFKNHTIPTPWCCPARASILTGLYSHNTGMTNQVGPIFPFKDFVRPLDFDGNPMVDENGKRINNEDRTFARFLHDAGYRTAMVGKYLNGPPPGHVPVGWDEYYGVLGDAYSGYDYELTESTDADSACKRLLVRQTEVVGYPKLDANGALLAANYSTDVFAEKAIRFVECADRLADDQPFLLYVTPTAPHAPIEAAPRHAALQKIWEDPALQTFRTHANFKEADVSDKPAWLRNSVTYRDELLDGVSSKPGAMGDGVVRDYTRRMGSLYAVDEMIARLVQTLKEKGEWENTVFVFSSDNGFNLGAHHFSGKHVPFEESARVPMFVAGANVRQGVTELLSNHIDLAPTFLELAGAKIPGNVDGRSLVSHFQVGKAPEWQRQDLLFRVKSTAAFLYPYATSGKNPKLSPALFDLGLVQHSLEVNDLFHDAEAKTVADALVGRSSYVRQLIDQMEQFDNIPGYRALKSTRYTYVEWFENHPYQAPVFELYDNVADPYQLNNLLATPGFPATELFKIRQRLEKLSRCSGAGCW